MMRAAGSSFRDFPHTRQFPRCMSGASALTGSDYLAQASLAQNRTAGCQRRNGVGVCAGSQIGTRCHHPSPAGTGRYSWSSRTSRRSEASQAAPSLSAEIVGTEAHQRARPLGSRHNIGLPVHAESGAPGGSRTPLHPVGVATPRRVNLQMREREPAPNHTAQEQVEAQSYMR